MLREDKEPLLKYLCMALPYKVKTLYVEYEMEIRGIDSVSQTVDVIEWGKHRFSAVPIEEIKPYLRSMSSMTEEEKEELLNLLFDKEAKYFYIDEEGLIDGRKFNLFKEGINYPSFCPINIVLYTNWLLENHFDFMNLISKDLAIEVTKENNPYES